VYLSRGSLYCIQDFAVHLMHCANAVYCSVETLDVVISSEIISLLCVEMMWFVARCFAGKKL